MIRQVLHVSVLCDRCYDGLTDDHTDPAGAAPVWFAGRTAALAALGAALGTGGWVRLFSGELLCPACAAEQTCTDYGHAYADDDTRGWRMCACGRSIPAHAFAPPDPAGGEGCGMTWRICGRCDHIDEHPITEHDDDPDPDERDEPPERGAGSEVQPGGFLRQDVPAGLALPTHTPHPTTPVGTDGHESSEETPMVEPDTTAHGARGAAGAGIGGGR